MTATTEYNTGPLNEVLRRITAERFRQLAKWGDQDHEDPWWYVILGEEFGEVGRAIFETERSNGDPTVASLEHLLDELVQNAAVATAWAEKVLLSIEARRV